VICRGRGVVWTLAAAALAAQPRPLPVDPAERGEVALHQAVLDAGNDQLALLVASHPDDQYLHPATLLRFRYGWRVAVVLLTRGEGGQNVSGSETGDALAARRTEETARCAAMLGLDVHFLDRPDTGFCRGAEEALDLWGRVTTGNDLARLIRRLRPDVVWTTHHPAEEHGHDLALLAILPDAVERAASSLYRWDDLPPYRVPVTIRGCSPDEASAFELSGDGMEPIRGETYRALAYRALAEHRSQAPFRPMDEIYPPTLRLRPIGESREEPSAMISIRDRLFGAVAAEDGTRDEALALRTSIERDLPARVADREALLQLALDLRGRLQALRMGVGADLAVRAERRLAALDAVVVHTLSLSATAASVEGTVAVEGSTIPIDIRVVNGDVAAVDGVRVREGGGATLDGAGPVDLGRLAAGGVVERQVTCRLPVRRAPFAVAPVRPVRLLVEFELGSQRIAWPVPLELQARAPIELAATRPSLLWPVGSRSTAVAVRLSNHRDAAVKGTMTTRAPVGWSFAPASRDVELVAGSTTVFTFTLNAPDDVKPGVHTVRVRFQDVAAEIAVHSVEVVAAPASAVGLIPGVDDTSRRVLEDLGVELHVLDGDDVATFPLQRLHTVLVDIRALRVQATARAAFGRLLEFVHAGGRLVVLYHKDKEWEAPGFRGSPFPMTVGRGRVTQEDAPVRVLRPDHLLLRWPNRVLASDWDGWVQERGLYFAEDYDERYEEVLATADAGQPELRGGLLYVPYGAGDYVYCALSLFRQLKALHPGACRLFANLIAPSRASAGR